MTLSLASSETPPEAPRPGGRRRPRRVPVVFVEAFTRRPFGGNPAGIVPDARALEEAELQALPREFGMEFGYVYPPQRQEADFRVRFFTPGLEASVSGHVTLATFFALAHLGRIEVPEGASVTVAQETAAGVLPVRLRRQGGAVRVAMELVRPTCGVTVDAGRVAAALNIRPEAITQTGLEPQVVSAGIGVLVVPVAGNEILAGMRPNSLRTVALSRELRVSGPVPFVPHPSREEAVATRCFFPLYGTDEDVVSGTAVAAVGCYLARHRRLRFRRGWARFVSVQGAGLGRPNEALCEVRLGEEGVDLARVSGDATLILEGELVL